MAPKASVAGFAQGRGEGGYPDTGELPNAKEARTDPEMAIWR
jgi:hypothetical protein